MSRIFRGEFLAKVLLAVAAMTVLCVGMAAHSAKPATDPFTVAVIPDTQYYCSTSPPAPTADIGTAEMYYDLTAWLKKHAAKEKMRFAIHLGDLIQDPANEDEWKIADAAQRTLEWSLPYSVLPGNHDTDQKTHEDALYDKYFGPQRFADQKFYGGHEGTKNNNNYCFFEGGGMKFMVLSIEYKPSAAVLAWANQVVADHPDHRVIVATHSYLNNDGSYTKDGGQDIRNKLVRRNDNIFMVIGGHVPGWCHRKSFNDHGRPVLEILTDYQWEPNGRSPEQYGGNGWLNLMRFVPSENKIHFSSYSPYLDRWWKDDPLHEYTLDYQMVPAPSALPFLVAALLAVCAWRFRWPLFKRQGNG